MASSGSAPKRAARGSRRLPRDTRRAQIIEAAAAAFLRAGFDATSMEDVAEHAGVSRIIVYRIFETKRHLYRAVLASVTDEFVTEFENSDMAEIRRRGGVVWVMLGIARRHPDAFRLLWRHAVHEPAFAHFARHFRLVVTDYAEAMIALDGRLDDPELVRWAATTLAAHLLDGMCSWLDQGHASRDVEYTQLQVCSLWAIIDAWGDPHPPDWLPRSGPSPAVGT